jgi:Zn-dependent protease with chaperone function
MNLFSSHPSTEERIARLKTIAAQMDQAPDRGPWA